MITLYLTCFVLGLILSLLAAFAGLGHLHLGHVHLRGPHVHAKHPGSLSALNGFTVPAFLCWFGGAGYVLATRGVVPALVIVLATVAGLIGASLFYVVLFKILLPRERVLAPEDTRMEGVIARVSDEIRPDGGTGEILFTQLETRRSAAARSETGQPIPRNTEVVVLRYQRGIAYVAPLETIL